MSRRLILSVLLLLVLIAILGTLIGVMLAQYSRSQQEILHGTAQIPEMTNGTVQAFIFATQTAKHWTKTPTPDYSATPVQTENPAIATHHADNTHAYATATAILAQFDATQTASSLSER
jgi:hypothetical protein